MAQAIRAVLLAIAIAACFADIRPKCHNHPRRKPLPSLSAID
jgi:hypothetical protein